MALVSNLNLKFYACHAYFFHLQQEKCNFTVKNQVVEIVQHFHLIVNMLVAV